MIFFSNYHTFSNSTDRRTRANKTRATIRARRARQHARHGRQERARAGEGEAGAGVAARRAEGAERGDRGWPAADGGCQAAVRSQYASDEGAVWEGSTGKYSFFLYKNGLILLDLLIVLLLQYIRLWDLNWRWIKASKSYVKILIELFVVEYFNNV